MKPRFFASATKWRKWLDEHHDVRDELWVGFYKKGSGRPSITWPESVDGALCFGWIDGIRKSVDDVSYAIRFTPRRAGSIWSSVNIKRVAALTDLGLMRPAGFRAYEKRVEHRSGVYGYEQRKKAKLTPAYQRKMAKNTEAWRFFRSQAPWYQRTASWWVMSAKKEETRLKRLATLIDASSHQRSIVPLRREPHPRARPRPSR